MYFVLLAAAVAILAGVVAVAMGGGGELAISRRDLPLIPPRIRTAADVSRLRLPLGLFGYQAESADEVLQVLAGQLAERDAEIARLRQEVQWLGAQRNGGASAAPPPSAAPRPSGAGPVIAAQPEAESLDTEMPDTEMPDTEMPDTEWPDTEWPGTESAGRELPGAESPGAELPSAVLPGTESPLSASGPAGGQPSAPN